MPGGRLHTVLEPAVRYDDESGIKKVLATLQDAFARTTLSHTVCQSEIQALQVQLVSAQREKEEYRKKYMELL